MIGSGAQSAPLNAAFDGEKAQVDLTVSTNGALMLNSSCQAIVRTYIQPSASPWYGRMQEILEGAQKLAKQWRTSGYLDFHNGALSKTAACATEFIRHREEVSTLFDQAIAHPGDDEVKAGIVRILEASQATVRELVTVVRSYEERLRTWGQLMQLAQHQMSTTVVQIQSQEVDIEADIKTINRLLSTLQGRITRDRNAIAAAKAKEGGGIAEIIIGIVLAPLSAGASLILTGIGVSSIAEANREIASMQEAVRDHQAEIASSQTSMSDDQKQVASLQGIVMAVSGVVSDVKRIEEALDPLKVTWDTFSRSLEGLIRKLQKSSGSQDFFMGKAWYISACEEWVLLDPDTHGASVGNLTGEVSIPSGAPGPPTGLKIIA